MRRLPLLICLGLAASAIAQQRPPKLEPIPERPPAVGLDAQGVGEPEVIIAPDQGKIIEEWVVEGKRRVRVVMPNGAEYVLEEDLGDGSSARQQPGDTGIRVPRWLIIRF